MAAPDLRYAPASEWAKTRTIPDTWVYLAGIVLLAAAWAFSPLVLGLEEELEYLRTFINNTTVSPLPWLGLTRLSIIAAIVFGAMLVTSERESGTAITTRALYPRPLAVYGSKLLIAGLLGAVTGFLSSAAVLLVTRVLHGPEVAPLTTDPAVLFTVSARVAVITALCALAGVGLGAITRSLFVAAVIGFVWVWFENVAVSIIASGLPGGEIASMIAPWRNLSYFIDGNGFGLPFLWSAGWGFAPLAVLALILVLVGAARHHADTHTTKE